jgi:two-component system, LuxR family, response regulator FixJ
MNSLGSLSPDEREVVELTVAGNSDRVIAWHLGIPTSAVQNHRTAAMTMLGAGTLAELVPLTLASWNEGPRCLGFSDRC